MANFKEEYVQLVDKLHSLDIKSLLQSSVAIRRAEVLIHEFDRTRLFMEQLTLREISQLLITIQNFIDLIQKDRSGYESEQQRNSQTTFEVQTFYDRVNSIFGTIFERIQADELTIEKRLETERTLYREALEQLNSDKDKFQAQLNDFDRRYSEQLKKLEFFKQEDLFEMISKDYKKISWIWLGAIIVTSLVFVLVVVNILFSFCFEQDCISPVKLNGYQSFCETCGEKVLILEIVKAISYRVLIVSFLLFLIAFCVRNYNNNMHNYVVANHKSNSLSAALILIDRSKTDQGKDALMNLAATAIFSHQPTGFNKKDPENIMSTIGGKIVDKI